MILKRASWLGAWLTAAVIAYLAMGEIGAIIGDISVPGGTYSPASLYSVTQVWQAGTALHEWAIASCAGIPVRSWLVWLLAFDVLFIAGYTGFGLGASLRWNKLKKIRWWLIGLAAADLIGDVLTGWAVGIMPAGSVCTPGVSYHHGVLAGFLGAATAVKTALILVVAGIAIWVAVLEDPGHAAFRRVLKALGLQRFIIIVAAFLTVILLLPGAPILEQGVDAERSWVLVSDHWLGAAWAGWGLLMFLALMAGLWYLAGVRAAPFAVGPGGEGRTMAEEASTQAGQAGTQAGQAGTQAGTEPGQAAGKPSPGQVRSARLVAGAWLLVAAGVTGIVALAGLTPWVRVYWHSAYWTGAVLGLIAVLSVLVARRAPRPDIEVDSPEVRRRALQIGRALAGAVLVILLISACRAFVAPMILLPRQRTEFVIIFSVLVLLAAGGAVLILWRAAGQSAAGWRLLPDAVQPRLVGARAAHPDAGQAAPAGQPPADQAAPAGQVAAPVKVPGWVTSVLPAALLAIACGIPLVIFPVHTSRTIGFMGIVGLSLLLLTACYSVLQITAQLTEAPHIFRLAGLRRAPVVTIVVLIAVLATVTGTSTSLHDIRQPGQASLASQRPTLEAALNAWQDGQNPACAVPVAGVPGGRVQPLVLVAAEGGGVRAAWWTVDVMASLTSTNCGARSVFLTSGVSGGAIGLAVMDSSVLHGSPTPYTQMQALAGPDALAAGSDGLLSRDLAAGSLGVNVRAADGPASAHFPDRATLIEQAWQSEDPGLARPFPRTRTRAGTGATTATGTHVPWYTVFNGTSVAGTCRVLISDVVLTGSTRCDDPASPMPGAYDLLTAEPCVAGVSTVTASLLAARFPYVTPSGVVRACPPASGFRDQIIDGGYSENSGIGTLDGALAQLMPQIRAYNQAALQAGKPLEAPLVIFLHNTVISTSQAATQPAARAEILVPPTSESDKGVLGATSTLLQQASGIASDWVPDSVNPAQAATLRAAAAKVLGHQAMTVAPQRVPAFALPLGWTMSEGTRDTLDQAYNSYLNCSPSATRTCTASQAYDSLIRAWCTTMEFPLPAHPARRCPASG